MSYLDRIDECNQHDLTTSRRFVVAGEHMGWVRPGFADALGQFPAAFTITDTAVTFAADPGSVEARTALMADVTRQLHQAGAIPQWLNEPYVVAHHFDEPPHLIMDRAAIAFFGVRAFGVHMNGFVKRADGIHMWIARRADDRMVSPGKLDNMVAGGQPAGLSLMENLIKECAEEADIPPDLAKTATAQGQISYQLDGRNGLKPDTMFVYDLEVPHDFEPQNTDGEIKEFYLMPVQQVAKIVRDTTDFKLNCNLVIIDFLIRHGVIGPDDADFAAIKAGLRQ